MITDVIAAIQAAWAADERWLAREIRDRYEIDVCLSCGESTKGRLWYLCLRCSDDYQTRISPRSGPAVK